MKIGWFNNIQAILTDHKLPTDFTTIKSMSHNEWKLKVQKAIEKKNIERLHEECHETTNEIKKVKTKTASIPKQLADPSYKREPRPEIQKSTKHEAKTIIIARYGMLQCGKNYQGTMNKTCDKCNCIDDENHRLNYCVKWKDRNYHNETGKVDFDLIYSNEIAVLRSILPYIEKLWNTRNANGTMHTG